MHHDDPETQKRREIVAGEYSGPKWKHSVARMPPHQITALYLRIQRDGSLKPKEEPKPPSSVPEQLSLDLTGESMVTVDEPDWKEPRPIPCPECSSTKGYSRVGIYRSQCLNCNALLKNAEINQEDLEP